MTKVEAQEGYEGHLNLDPEYLDEQEMKVLVGEIISSHIISIAYVDGLYPPAFMPKDAKNSSEEIHGINNIKDFLLPQS